MPLPTLLVKGSLVPPVSMSSADKTKLKETIPIDYLINFISERIPASKGAKIKRAPKSYGDRVLILKSETGSGKSTVLPPYLYTKLFDKTRKNIAVTQPRVLTAIDIPMTIIPFFKELQLDKNIGYQTQQFKRLPSEKGIIFSTVGVIVQQLIMWETEDFLKKYQFIILDEVHERDIETDLCLFLLKKLIKENWDSPECPLVILMSATFNEKIFINYFNTPKENYIQITGSTFPIEPHFTPYDINNYVEYACATVKKLHLDNFADLENDNIYRDIIIFVQSTGNGQKIYKDLMTFNSTILLQNESKIAKYNAELTTIIDKTYKTEVKGGAAPNYILPIFLNRENYNKGGLQYQQLFSDLDMISVPVWKVGKNGIDLDSRPEEYVTPTRRIIISTPIAETGVTFETLKYCVDTGFYFSIEFQPTVACKLMADKNITNGMATQRRGRVGRKSPGQWYPCYTETTFNNLPKDQLSKILISDTTENILGIIIKENKYEIVEEISIKKLRNNAQGKNEGLFQMHVMSTNSWFYLKHQQDTNFAALDFIELPSMNSLEYSTEKLNILGFLDDEYHITTPGFFANQLRFINLELRRTIMAGYHYGANILDLITISAFVYTQKRNIFGKFWKMENFLKVADTEFVFYNQILFADDFINCVIVWNLFQEFIHKRIKSIVSSDIQNSTTSINKKIIYINDVRDWCAEHGLLYDGLITVIAMRDQIIENMIAIGLNPYYNSLGLKKSEYNLNDILRNNLTEGLTEIKKFKHCLFEGYKCNILRYNPRGFEYRTLWKNIPVRVMSPFTTGLNTAQSHPEYIIVADYVLKKKRNGAQFGFSSDDYVSVLDNFVSVDDKIFIK